VNFGTPVPLLIGIILILGALALFFLEKFRPGYERDSDKVYAVLLLISGLFLLAHLDMELLASFQQLLMAGMLTALLIESIRNRLPRAEVAPPADNRFDNRPSRPRYDNRPPSRRVYRAELDDRGIPLQGGAPMQPNGTFPAERNRPPRMAPAPDPRMAQARNAAGEYWREDYREEYNDGRTMPRQPYEEYRGPVGRLQPSDANNSNDRTASRPRDDRYPSADYPPADYSNGRYGERPPARPPATRPADRSGDRPVDRSSDRAIDRAVDRAIDRGPQDLQQRPERRPENPANFSEDSPVRPSGNASGNTSSNAPASSDRSLNIRPYSEAPKLNLPRDPSRRPPAESGSTEGSPSAG